MTSEIPKRFSNSETKLSTDDQQTPEPQVEPFTEVDSKIQALYFHAVALVGDPKRIEGRMTESKKGEMSDIFSRYAAELGVRCEPSEVISMGEYNPNGIGITRHRERFLNSFRTEHEIISFPQVDRRLPNATMNVAD